MEIPDLVAEVPTDFRLTLEPKRDNERIIGALDDLGPDTKTAFHALCYFNEQYRALGAAHATEHAQEGFVPQGEACRRNANASSTIQEKILTLRAFIIPTIFAQFGIEEEETIGFRAEGIIAFATPESEDPLLAILQGLGGRGVGVIVVGVGPGGQLTELTPEAHESED